MDKESTIIENQKRRKEEKVWWMSPKRKDVYKLLIKGKSINDIAEELAKQPANVIETVSHPIFLGRLERYLTRTFFNFQVNKVLAVDEVFKLYWDVVTGRQVIDGLDRDQASKHFIKLLGLHDKEPKVLNPKQYNIIMNVLHTDTKSEDLGEEFGYEELEIKEDEKPKVHPQLDKGQEDSDEQGTEDRI